MTVFERAVDQIAPHLRDGALVVLRSTVYPGTTEYVAQHLAARGCRVDVAFCPERIAEGHALEELGSLPQIVGADAPAAGDRAAALFERLGLADRPDDDEGGRAGQAPHQHLAVHEVRRRQPVLHDRPPGRRRLHQRPAGDPRGLPAGRGPARPGLRRRARACSRTRCSWRPSPATTSRWARPRCRSTRACRPTSSPPSSGATARSGGKTVGILGMAFKAESDDTRASLSYKLRKLLAWAGATVLCTDPYVVDDRLVAARAGRRRERHPRPRRPAPGVPRPRARRQGRRRRLGRARRGDPAVNAILVTGAAGFICGYLVPELLEARPRGDRPRRLQQVRPPRQVVRRPSRAIASSRATPRTRRSSRELAADCDQVVAAAAMIGGISYFHEFAYDLLAENERILASTFDAAIAAHRDGHLERIVVLSSSMVYESATVFPTPEGAQLTSAAAGLHVRLPEARVRVLRAGAPRSSTSCRTRSCGRSTAWASASAGPCATRTS